MAEGIITICLITFLSDLTPGPNFWKIVHHAVAFSRRESLVFATGLLTASGLHCLLGFAGVAALLSESEAGLMVVQLAGGGYIAFYGVQMLLARKRSRPAMDAAGHTGRRALRLWLDGVLTNCSNPKTILFYASLFAVVMKPSQSHAYVLVLVPCVLATSLATNASVACFFSLDRVQTLFARWEQAISRMIGGMLVVAGLKIALQARG